MHERCGADIWCAPSGLLFIIQLEHGDDYRVIKHNVIVEIERSDSLSNHGGEFKSELVQPQPEAGTCEEFQHMNIEVFESHISKRPVGGFD
jgi:hypothetical protein